MGYAKSEETKNKLLNTTMRLLRTQGYSATGISQILAESNVPKGSLYYHFPQGKVELALSAIKVANSSIATRLTNIQKATPCTEDAIQIYFDHYIFEMINSNYQKGCPIATVALEAAATIDPIQQECKSAFNNMQNIVELYLQQDGVSQEESTRLAVSIIAGFEGALVLSKAQRSTTPLEIVRDNLIQQIHTTVNQTH